jgi:3-hydroxyisobutyrate dehydrogenase
VSGRIGILGYGRMGAPLARRLHQHGFEVTVFDVDEYAMARARADLLPTAPDRASLATHSDILMTVLPGPIECRNALTGVGGALEALAAGSVWLDFTSNDPQSVSTLVSEATRRGVGSVAAPLRGGPADAARGTLGFYLAGDSPAVGVAWDVLTALGHLGAVPASPTDPASAHVLKLLANTLWFGQVIAVTETLLLGRALGWDPAALRTALLDSPGASAFLELHGPALLVGDRMPDFALGRVVEELDTVLRLAKGSGTPHEMIELITRTHRDALAAYGDVDGELLAAALLEDQAGRPLMAGTEPREDRPPLA